MKIHCVLCPMLFMIGCTKAQSISKVEASHSKHIAIPGAHSTEEYMPLLKGKRVGIVVNQTSRIGNVHLLDSLISLKVNVVKVFAPEHGLRGSAEAGAHISDSVDVKTGIPILSLYGKKKKPLPEDLAGIDVMVFDIQDVGARFYTYISTLHYLMEALADADIPLIVFDRPNPNGHYIDGPVLDTAYSSFVGMDPVPVVYGMTIGEYGQMVNGEKWIPKVCSLTVIRCRNYEHTTMYDLPVKPSPNLPNLRSILLYPGLCFFEGTSVSIGRGTDMQFQVVGHPDFPEKKFSFTPRANQAALTPPQKDVKCYGLDLTRLSVDSLFQERKLNLSILLLFYDQLENTKFFNASWFDTLAGGKSLREAIESGKTEAEIRAGWVEGIEGFKKVRGRYLLYGDFEK